MTAASPLVVLRSRHRVERASHPMEAGTYHATLFRIGGLVGAGSAAMALAYGTAFATLA